MPELDIGEVARRARVKPSTLRFYEEKGLLAPIGRHGLRRRYDAAVLERLALIALGRAAGFSLEEMRPMLAQGRRPAIDRRRLSEKADALDRTIRGLVALRSGLRHAAACPAQNHLDCPTFRRLMGDALAGTLPATRGRARLSR